MPSLEKLHREFKDQPFVIIGIDIQESRETVLRYIRRKGISYINLLDEDGRVSALYNVRSTPVKFLLDTRGNMVGAAIGYRDWEQEEFRELIRLLMKQ
ncbi:MAG: TlpA family protein disulfide reductase [Deferribacteres bacterium]|nr:TlpA family protein disulfide reductase [Deferribacteres bacterium]